jgi:putative transposase
MLEYKLAWRGKQLVKIDRFYPLSKPCSICGFVNQVLTLDERAWTCPACGTAHDRDVNAAINIKREGILILRENNITVMNNDDTAGTAGIHASRDHARPANSLAMVREGRIHAR